MTNRRLLLMRHAKSDWADESLSDHDRPLNGRGRGAAPRMADWIRQLGELPDRILCSSSTRTCQTAQLLMDTWQTDPPIITTESLYLASPNGIVDVIQAEGGDAGTLLVIAHNPGMTALVSGLAGQSVDMPTAATALFEVPFSSGQESANDSTCANIWQTFGDCEGLRWIDFAKPKALP